MRIPLGRSSHLEDPVGAQGVTAECFLATLGETTWTSTMILSTILEALVGGWVLGGMHGMGGMPGGSPHRKRQDPAVVHNLQVSLEDIYKGTSKKMKITRKVLNPDGRSVRPEDKVLTIDIKPGWKAGTKVTFPKEGDQTPNNVPADIVFVIKDKPHPLFTRDGSDIKYKVKIGLREVSVNVMPIALLFQSCNIVISILKYFEL